ncbi:Single-stranded nucleic acid binding protein [Mycena sanguinolenta]|uniref:Probable RNA-binding protein 18 n=1 Tax=Mycena sanguinolenta TaxID=230812 RepID=A0A8H6XQ62_9AGAR|nr:Single-stranded nucleic acid binding protein [Mycena sanguinolenta]
MDQMATPGPEDPTAEDSLDHYLTHPTYSEEETVPEASSSKVPAQSRQILQDRLYIGNLHPTVDEYSLLQIFSKFGKITKLDFLFHKTGLLKGKPRGYAFVEYGNKDDALKALSMAHNKLLRGRKLVVTFAQQAPLDPGGGSAYGANGSRNRKVMTESGRPTTLNIHQSRRTRDKIAMMEAKLRQMEKSPQNPDASRPIHASLPPKPLPPDTPIIQGLSRHEISSNEPQRQPQRKPPPPLPSLPLLSGSAEPKGLRAISGGSKGIGTTARKIGPFAGVKLGKSKEKDKGGQKVDSPKQIEGAKLVQCTSETSTEQQQTQHVHK